MENKDINAADYIFKCTCCKLEKPNSEFHKDSGVKRLRKYKYYCKKCTIKKGTDNGYYNKARIKRKIEDPLAYLYYISMSNAKKKNLEFSITKDDLVNIFSNQHGLCFYTNRRLETIFGKDMSISLDRKDSNRGYILDNIVLCGWKINRMKNDASIEELLLFCKDIIKTIGGKENI